MESVKVMETEEPRKVVDLAVSENNATERKSEEKEKENKGDAVEDRMMSDGGSFFDNLFNYFGGTAEETERKEEEDDGAVGNMDEEDREAYRRIEELEGVSGGEDENESQTCEKSEWQEYASLIRDVKTVDVAVPRKLFTRPTQSYGNNDNIVFPLTLIRAKESLHRYTSTELLARANLMTIIEILEKFDDPWITIVVKLVKNLF